MSLEERFQLVRSVGEECIQEDELRNLLDKKPLPICYDGFEPSGRMHIAQVYSFLLFQSSFYFVPRVFCC
jgi:tyrosyl-tRNA synthetase